jgi:hypothetical protein
MTNRSSKTTGVGSAGGLVFEPQPATPMPNATVAGKATEVRSGGIEHSFERSGIAGIELST